MHPAQKESTLKRLARRLLYVKTRKNYTPVRERLSENLARIRIAAGFTQEGLGSVAGLHRTYVGHLERRMRNPSLENVEKLAMALEVDVVDLLADTPA